MGDQLITCAPFLWSWDTPVGQPLLALPWSLDVALAEGHSLISAETIVGGRSDYLASL